MQKLTWRHTLLMVLPLALLGACSQQGGQEEREIPAAGPAMETSRDFGDYVVHYRAFRSDELTPQIARSYGITRSQNRALLNISIIRKQEGTIGVPVKGAIRAEVHNLVGQYKDIQLREIEDGDAVYYLGETSISNAETLIFNVDVTPMGEGSRFAIRFRQQFFTT
jgi:hypothetical protein